MRLFGLIGYPLSHSFSKQYFTAKFERENITDCRYELFPIESIDKLPELLAANPQLEGLNVTIPYKQQVLPWLTDRSNLPLEACNCIVIKEGKLTGYNTDVTGFEGSFTPLLQPHHNKALILGTGGAAAAVQYILGKLGIAYKMVSRTPGNGLVYEDIDAAVIAEHNIIINTTPLGTYPNTEACAAIPYRYITPQHYMYDLVYNPSKTKFLLLGEANGATIKNGADMLEIQAEANWKIWNS